MPAIFFGVTILPDDSDFMSQAIEAYRKHYASLPATIEASRDVIEKTDDGGTKVHNEDASFARPPISENQTELTREALLWLAVEANAAPGLRGFRFANKLDIGLAIAAMEGFQDVYDGAEEVNQEEVSRAIEARETIRNRFKRFWVAHGINQPGREPVLKIAVSLRK